MNQPIETNLRNRYVNVKTLNSKKIKSNQKLNVL